MTARNKAIKQRIAEARSLAQFINKLELPKQRPGGITNDNYQQDTHKEYLGLEKQALYRVRSKKAVKISTALAAVKGI